MTTPRTLLNLLRSYNRYKTRALAMNRKDLWGDRQYINLCEYFIDCPLVKYLGAGNFAVVVECEGRVFKIIKKSDHAYDAFAEFCRLMGPTRYLPEFKGKGQVRGFTVYELEKLTRFLSVDHRETIDNLPKAVRREKCDELKAVIALMYEFITDENGLCIHSWDCHNGNFATRDKFQLVIIDPWC